MRTSGRIPLALCVLFVVALPSVASAHPANAPAPTVTVVSPGQAFNYQATTITITGSGFVATPEVKLGSMRLFDVIFVSSTTLTAIVPSDLPGGIYSLTVTNPDSQNATMANAIVVWSGNGNLGPWSVISTMSSERGGLAAVVARGYVFALGGRTGDTGVYDYLNTVERAAINADGSLGPWQSVNSMITARAFFAAVVAGNYVYAIGGTNGTNALKTVERAFINANGTLGAWGSVSSMISARSSAGAALIGNYVYALGGYNVNSVERAQVNANGSLGSWQSLQAMATWHNTAAAVGPYLYALGGGASGQPADELAIVNPNGLITLWTSLSTNHEYRRPAVIARGYIYAFRGRYWPVERAAIQPDGTLGSWQNVNSLYQPRDDPATVVTRSYVYALGGESGLDHYTTNSVQRALIQPISLSMGYFPLLRK